MPSAVKVVEKENSYCTHYSLALECSPDAPIKEASRVLRQHHPVGDVEMAHMGAWNLVRSYHALSHAGFTDIAICKLRQDKQGVKLQFVELFGIAICRHQSLQRARIGQAGLVYQLYYLYRSGPIIQL